MKCSGCGTENRAGRRFCTQCEVALELWCTSCGAANEPGDRFCGDCGTPLTARATASPAPDVAAPPASERRLVSVLFADLAEAHLIFEQLRAAPWLERVDALGAAVAA